MQILITLSAVRPGTEDELAAVLAEVGAHPADNAHLPLGASTHTHFARFVVLGEPGATRLLFVANFDGPLMEYLAELVEVSPGLDAIFGCCAGYQGKERFVDFVRAGYCPPRGVYIGFPGMTAAQIRDHVALREGVERLADQLVVPAAADGADLADVLGILGRLPASTPRAVRAARRLDALGRMGLTAVQDAERNLLLKFAEAFARQGQAPSFPKVFPAVGDEAHADRDRAQAIQTAEVGKELIQNQMTTVTRVRPERLARLQFALAGTSLLSKWSWPPGEFAGVGSLHFFAWALVDHGRELIFLSVFDGSWKNYMQDFMDKLVWGLDSLYANTYDYPAAGMKDSNAFTRYVLDHQWPPQVFYSAYPNETVMNLMRDRTIVGGLPTGGDALAARSWLEAL